MSTPATTTVYYTIYLPTTGDPISGDLSIIYDTFNNTATLNSVNVTSPAGNYTDASSYNPIYITGVGSYQLQLNGSGGQTIIDFTDSDLWDSTAVVNAAQSDVMMSSFQYTSGGTMSSTLTETSCFTPGTLISTPTGSTPVQDLQIGDLILNNVGQLVPVKWIGTQLLHPAFAGDSLPICIRAEALGNNLPTRDLYVSPRHALYIDDCLLIEAKALINGTTITQVTQWEGDIEYLHIETEHHEIILAEGAPAETFMDNVSRTHFNNYSEYQALYPEAHEMIELEIPRISHQRQLPNVIKAKLDAAAEGLMVQEKAQLKA